MSEVIKIEATGKKKALEKAREHFGENFDIDKIVIEKTKEKRGFLSFFGLNKKNIYRVELKDEYLHKGNAKVLDNAEEVGVNGEMKIKFAKQGVFLKVVPPEGKGESVTLKEAFDELENKKIVEIDEETVREVVKEADEDWHKIAPRKPELDTDGEVEVEFNEDKLKGFISYTPARGGKEINLVDVRKKLKEEGVVYGVKEEKIKEILSFNSPQKHVLIAEGEEPESGKDAEIIYHFEEKEESVGTEREDGSIDFYNLGLINNVEEGDILATLEESEPGEPGMTVTGEEISPPEPNKKSLKAGKNVKKRDEKTLIADVAGQVVKKNEKVEVLPVHEVKGDVDLNTGNIDFVGNVYVRGDVHEGFEVKARGNVEIRGNVSGAKIISGGEVIVHKGFIGKEKGIIKADGDVKAKFVENGTIRSGGNIEISDAVMHSKLSAREKIIITKRKGLLVGGETRATSEIEVNIVGSALATETKIAAGVNPELKNRLAELEDELEEDNQNLLKTKKAFNLLEKMKKKSKLPPGKESTYNKLSQTIERLETGIDKKEEERDSILKRIKNSSQGRIRVYSKVFPGVQINIGKAQQHIKNETSHTMFVEDEGEVKMVTL